MAASSRLTGSAVILATPSSESTLTPSSLPAAAMAAAILANPLAEQWPLALGASPFRNVAVLKLGAYFSGFLILSKPSNAGGGGFSSFLSPFAVASFSRLFLASDNVLAAFKKSPKLGSILLPMDEGNMLSAKTLPTPQTLRSMQRESNSSGTPT